MKTIQRVAGGQGQQQLNSGMEGTRGALRQKPRTSPKPKRDPTTHQQTTTKTMSKESEAFAQETAAKEMPISITATSSISPAQELQKKHVLKVEELPRRRMAEDFEEGTSFFQGSNVKTVYIIGDNDARYPDAEIVDEHNRNSLASPLCFQEREASASLLQVYHSQRESLFQRAQSIFFKYGETRILDFTKGQI